MNISYKPIQPPPNENYIVKQWRGNYGLFRMPLRDRHATPIIYSPIRQDMDAGLKELSRLEIT
jgi:hypothetical protein